MLVVQHLKILKKAARKALLYFRFSRFFYRTGSVRGAVALDRETEDTQFNLLVERYLVIEGPFFSAPANDDLLLASLQPYQESCARSRGSVEIDEFVIIPSCALEEGNTPALPFSKQSFHLHVTAEEVIKAGKYVIIDGEEISKVTFQDAGWTKLRDDNCLSSLIEAIEGYHVYTHCTGAVLQLDKNINIMAVPLV